MRNWTSISVFHILQFFYLFFLQITVSEEGKIGVHGWLPYDKTISNYFLFEKDPSITATK